MSLSSMWSWFGEPAHVPTWDGHSGSCCAVAHPENGHQTLGVWASGFFPDGSEQRGGKKRASYSFP